MVHASILLNGIGYRVCFGKYGFFSSDLESYVFLERFLNHLDKSFVDTILFQRQWKRRKGLDLRYRNAGC
jgi:hypothetical protein